MAFLEGVEPRRVADAVERLRLRELLVDERDDMAPRREHPREVLCCGRRRMKNIRRDEVDYLPEDRVHCLRCFWWCLFLHNPVGYRITPPVATLNIHPIANAVSEWDANELEYNLRASQTEYAAWGQIVFDGPKSGFYIRKMKLGG